MSQWVALFYRDLKVAVETEDVPDPYRPRSVQTDYSHCRRVDRGDDDRYRKQQEAIR